AVGAEHRAFRRGLRAGSRGEAVGGEVGRRALGAQLARPSRAHRGRAAHRFRLALARTQAPEEHPRPGPLAVGVALCQLAGLALELLRRHHLGEEAAQPAVEGGQRRGKPRLPLVTTHDQGVSANLGEATAIEGKLRRCAPPGWELMARWMARARWIMSTRPSVQSYWASSFTGTHRTSAASLPAASWPPTGSAT